MALAQQRIGVIEGLDELLVEVRLSRSQRKSLLKKLDQNAAQPTGAGMAVRGYGPTSPTRPLHPLQPRTQAPEARTWQL